MKRSLTVISFICLAACGKSQDESILQNARIDNVTVAQIDDIYSATLTGVHAARLKASLTQTPYTTANGGLRIDCNVTDDRCDIMVSGTSKDLDTVHRPQDGGNTSLFQAWLTGNAGKDFYTKRVVTQERFISNDMGLKTYEKQVLSAQGTPASFAISCYRKVIPRLVILWTTTYECSFALDGFHPLRSNKGKA